MRTFVDTNVWVYAYDFGDLDKRRRAHEVLAQDPDGLVVSPQVMGELYVTLTRKMPGPTDRASAESAVRSLADLRVAPIESTQVLDALEIASDGQVAYWDALLVATARAAGCERILTEDLTAGAVIAGVRVENPFVPPQRRLAEARTQYSGSPTTWDDAALREALARYEAVCRDAGMRPNSVHSYWDYARRFLDWREGLYPRHAAARPVPRRMVGIQDLRADAAAYEQALRAAGRRPAALATYVRHALHFVRWLEGTFHPGARLR